MDAGFAPERWLIWVIDVAAYPWRAMRSAAASTTRSRVFAPWTWRPGLGMTNFLEDHFRIVKRLIFL